MRLTNSSLRNKLEHKLYYKFREEENTLIPLSLCRARRLYLF